MATIYYTITSGAAPFEAILVPSAIPPNNHNSVGTYFFSDVPNGVYLLVITDTNNCTFQQKIIVDPLVSNIDVREDSIVIGNTDDIYLIFDINATNRIEHYSGYPDENLVELYLWFKTYDGKPLTTNKAIIYSISSNNITNNNRFTFNCLSDEVHVEINEITSGSSPLINGDLLLKEGFIETFFKYTYVKDPIAPDFTINIQSSDGSISNQISLVAGVYIYGMNYIDTNNAIMNY